LVKYRYITKISSQTLVGPSLTDNVNDLVIAKKCCKILFDSFYFKRWRNARNKMSLGRKCAFILCQKFSIKKHGKRKDKKSVRNFLLSPFLLLFFEIFLSLSSLTPSLYLSPFYLPPPFSSLFFISGFPLTSLLLLYLSFLLSNSLFT